MKTMKLTLISILLTVAVVSVSFAGETTAKTSKKVTNVSLQETNELPGLTTIMHLQLDPSFLNQFQLVYHVDVKYRNYNVRVSGTYIQWMMFFYPDGTKLSRMKKVNTDR